MPERLDMPTEPRPRTVQQFFSGLVGLFLALSLLKWGNPVVMDGQVGWPASLEEWKVASWPVVLGYLGFGLILVTSIPVFRFSRAVSIRFQLIPLVWFGWQVLATIASIQPSLSWSLIPHFAVCVGLFFIGLHCFSALERDSPLWLGLCGGFAGVLVVGWYQHFIGLESTRQYLYSIPNWQELPPAFLKKMASNRIYSTLVYPNALASVILLLTPVSLGLLTQMRHRRGRFVVAAALVVGSAACLYWSGSKAGWLIALLQIAAFVLFGDFPRRLKVWFVGSVFAVGLTAFAFTHHAYFQRGATSLGARIDYWNAAGITITKSPFLGEGPGTFLVYYRSLKAPEAEITRLAHNDYLQQGSDSGLVGALAYSAFWVMGLFWLYRNRSQSSRAFGLFLGLFGVSLHGLVEFCLYIPAVSWVSWFLFGWALSLGNGVDKRVVHS